MKDYSNYEVNNSDPGDKKRYVRTMFDSIVPTYDFLNRFLSLGIDNFWRKDLVKLAGKLENKKVLDICCGTGDLTRKLFLAGGQVYSLDFSFNMLKKGVDKGWLSGINIQADAGKLPFIEKSFDVITIAFGIRNIPDVDIFLSETFRVLDVEGRLFILELTRPENGVVRFFYNLYLEKILPFFGGLFSGKKEAYRYLAGSISTFLDKDQLINRIKSAGFKEVEYKAKTLGAAAVYICHK